MKDTWHDGSTEMINNAIDRSGTETVTVIVRAVPGRSPEANGSETPNSSIRGARDVGRWRFRTEPVVT